MPDSLVSALIAALVSLVVACAGLVATVLQLRNARKKQDVDIAHTYSERLYEQRIAHYPEGYAILGKLRKRAAPHYLPHPDRLFELKEDINRWADACSLFFSRDTLQAYWELRGALGKNPAHGTEYSKEQADKLFTARNRLRRQMRSDIGNLYAGDVNDSETPEYWEYL